MSEVLDQAGRAAYEAYCGERGWKGFNGDPLPQWPEVKEEIKAGWRAAAQGVMRHSTEARRGDWCTTFSGKQFWPLAPRVEDICIEDIAHALSRICRFGGHCREFYSVAQHSFQMALQAPEHLRMPALLHDAAEAYVGDVIRPIKNSLPLYVQAELEIARKIEERYGLENGSLHSPEIRALDDRMLQTERRDLLIKTSHQWTLDVEGVEPLQIQINPLCPEAAEELFLQVFSI